MRYFVAVICFALVAALAIWPELRFDNISLALLVVAIVAILLPEFRVAFGRVKKLKLGEFEVELAERLKELAGNTEAVESSLIRKNRESIVTEPREEEIARWLATAGSDPRASLLVLAIEIEKTVRDIAQAADVPESKRPYPLSRQLTMLAEREFIDPRIVPLFRDFWTIRNSVVHGHHFELSEGKLYELVELGLRILRLLRAGAGRVSNPSENGQRDSSFMY